MEFVTPVRISKGELRISHGQQIMVLGSCFADAMGIRLRQNQFRCCVNPFGTLYNPLSISQDIYFLMGQKSLAADELYQADGLWHSWWHHGTFSASTAEETLAGINTQMQLAAQWLRDSSWLLITFGTSWVYRLRGTGQVVANCHKQPETLFERSCCTPGELVNAWQQTIRDIRLLNPRMQFVFTVSPIRHLRDGLHENQLSKATLLLAIDRLCQDNAGCHYFPAYELVMDELRDYRFYARDMLHPSDVAEDYIWTRFADFAFDDATQQAMRQWQDIRLGLQHRPLHPSSDAYRRFVVQLEEKINRLKSKFPTFDVEKELLQCHNLLNR